MSTSKAKNAIGVFDSGLGGLTVVKEIIKLLPNESIVYYGDTARVPYGTKSKESIIRFSHENTEELVKHNVKIVVVACNSSSSYALQDLQKKFKVPILGVIEPGAIRACQKTRSNRIGIIATSATINSQEYEKAIKRHNRAAKVYAQACPLFVPLVEEGWMNSSVAKDIATEYLKPLKRKKIDTLILGCTHYPLLKQTLRKVMGKEVLLIDSAQQMAANVRDVLNEQGLLFGKKRKPQHRFIVNDRPQNFETIARKFLGFELNKGIQYV